MYALVSPGGNVRLPPPSLYLCSQFPWILLSAVLLSAFLSVAPPRLPCKNSGGGFKPAPPPLPPPNLPAVGVGHFGSGLFGTKGTGRKFLFPFGLWAPVPPPYAGVHKGGASVPPPCSSTPPPPPTQHPEGGFGQGVEWLGGLVCGWLLFNSPPLPSALGHSWVLGYAKYLGLKVGRYLKSHTQTHTHTHTLVKQNPWCPWPPMLPWQLYKLYVHGQWETLFFVGESGAAVPPLQGGALAVCAHCALLFRPSSPERVPKHTLSKRPNITLASRACPTIDLGRRPSMGAGGGPSSTNGDGTMDPGVLGMASSIAPLPTVSG